MPIFLTRRYFLATCVAPLLITAPHIAYAGAQREETLSHNVATSMRNAIDQVNQPYLVFSTPEAGALWLAEMSERLKRYIKSEHDRKRILIMIQYESVRAGLDPQLVLGLIQVESAFRRYAVSHAGARGLMQVMPFWVRYIGKPEHNLFDIRTNLRYGCTILRHYLNIEKGNLWRALGRYNGSLGKAPYPNAVLGAQKNRWLYDGSL